MGMAASQARYLALLARKSNCEYEGQQINQSRLALSNQSSDLFNQMMALKVPSTPSKSDFTVQKYTFTDGVNTYTIDKWNKLSNSEGDGYNYAITYHYDETSYTGFQRYRINPQVKYSGVAPTKSVNPEVEVQKIQVAVKDMAAKEAEMNLKYTAYATLKAKAGELSTYLDTLKNINSCAKDDSSYTIKTKNEEETEQTYVYKKYSALSDDEKALVKMYVDKLIEYGAITEEAKGEEYSQIYYCKKDGFLDAIAFQSDLEAIGGTEGTPLAKTILPSYHVSGNAPEKATYKTMQEMVKAVDDAWGEYITAKGNYEAAEDIYESYDVPVSIGNIKIKPLASLSQNQMAAIKQILADMKEEDIDTNIKKCFYTLQEEYSDDNYIGGLYTFEMAGISYYTTYYDLYNSVVDGTGINSIDDQAKLPYYGAQDIEKPLTYAKRALIEKDPSGRFISMRIEDDSLLYDLKSVSETDELAYEDAMSEYNYQRALYDKQVSDINAKTSIIQRQDQNLELRLKQLDTEQNALNTEIDAVSKVVKDNIEKSFKTFSG